MKDKKDNKGSIVLYATFLIMVLSAIAMMLSAIMIINIRATTSSTNAINTYYAAESGIEAGLGTIKRNRDTQTVTLANTLTSVDAISYTFLTGTSRSTYSVDIVQNKSNLALDLPLYSTYQLDLFDLDSGDTFFPSGEGDGSIDISWSKGSCMESGDMEFTVKQFTPGTWSTIFDTTVEPTVMPCCYFAPPLTEGYSQRVTFRPLDCDLQDISIVVSDGSGSIINLPNYLTLTATGRVGTSSTKLVVDTIWHPPVSGLGEYVLFSESQIIK